MSLWGPHTDSMWAWRDVHVPCFQYRIIGASVANLGGILALSCSMFTLGGIHWGFMCPSICALMGGMIHGHLCLPLRKTVVPMYRRSRVGDRSP